MLIFKNKGEPNYENAPMNAENLNNNFKEANASNVYLDEEKVIGKWFGKPLYRKTINHITTEQRSYVWHNITNLKQVINAYGTCKRDEHITNLIPCNYTNWEICLFDFDSRGTATLVFSDNQWFAGVSDIYITLLYTKTTD